ncbi:phosphoadenylyl-sulfate reductase (thioredoxin) [Hypericibacter adhaerens]|uniref:Adenosine 5'-phosphosulfate reductase n=1 Tax=Hypericibacter adhaerens TaxID=2602016 RepID=A0A5J6N4H8_9PROT|nr:phosphoadenylyl-sulfate reductase [Hypericibacter adhaerens]QEX24334.1 phosphoadenylyl-sulfate reductase (thioredoxin) [Hypericibacter adhaerens]
MDVMFADCASRSFTEPAPAPAAKADPVMESLAGLEGMAAPAKAKRSPLAAYAADLDLRFLGMNTSKILSTAIRDLFPGRIAVVSSFGAEAAIVLQLVAEIDPSVPVIFLETGKHFDATLMYRDILSQRFGLTDLRSIEPDAAGVAAEDPDGDLWSRDPNRCCALRKVRPLERALKGFDAWITGRKRYHGAERSALPFAEASNGQIKINPLASWTSADVQAAFKRYRLPQHPLFDEGYASIGCAPCTRPIQAGENARDGRWSGTDKRECGIHLDYQI